MIGWLTPDAPSGNPVRRILVIPDTYLPSVNGALQELGEEFNWETFGDETPEEASQRMLAMFEDYSVSELSLGTLPRSFALPIGARIGTDVMVWTADSAAQHAGYWQFSSVAINRKFSFELPTFAGAHIQVFMMVTKGSASGIITLKDNGTNVATYDLYNASIQRNQLLAGNSFDITTDGVRTLEFIVASKNASSSNYQVAISEITVLVTFP